MARDLNRSLNESFAYAGAIKVNLCQSKVSCQVYYKEISVSGREDALPSHWFMIRIAAQAAP